MITWWSLYCFLGIPNWKNPPPQRNQTSIWILATHLYIWVTWFMSPAAHHFSYTYFSQAAVSMTVSAFFFRLIWRRFALLDGSYASNTGTLNHVSFQLWGGTYIYYIYITPVTFHQQNAGLSPAKCWLEAIFINKAIDDRFNQWQLKFNTVQPVVSRKSTQREVDLTKLPLVGHLLLEYLDIVVPANICTGCNKSRSKTGLLAS